MWAIISVNGEGTEEVWFAETETVAKLTFINMVIFEALYGIENSDINPSKNLKLNKFLADNHINKTNITDEDGDIITEKLASIIVYNNLFDNFVNFVDSHHNGWKMCNDVFKITDNKSNNYIEVSIWKITPERISNEKDYN